jgi:hypothetical protein
MTTRVNTLNLTIAVINGTSIPNIITNISNLQTSNTSTNERITLLNETNRTIISVATEGKYYYRYTEFESVLTGYTSPWTPTAINSGTTLVGIGQDENYPAIGTIRSGAAASGGYGFLITNTAAYLLGTNYTTTAVFRPKTRTYNITTLLFGWFDVYATNNVTQTDAVYINCTMNTTNATCRGEANNNGAGGLLVSPTNITFQNDTWVRANIYINSTTVATFTMWNASNQIWQSTVTGTLPTGAGRYTGHGIQAMINGTIATQNLTDVAFLSVGINKNLTR